MNLINPLPSDAFYLYHYTSTETAMKYILPTGTLMFNPFSKVNDPRECKQWDISPFVPMDWKLDLEGYDTIAKQVSDILKSNAKLLCFCRDKDEARGKWQPRALLDRGFARPSMWHHYGNAYDGICFMFDRRRLDSAFKKELDSTRLISGAVSYSDEGIVPNPGNDPFVIDMTRVRNMDDYIHSIVAHHAQWLSKLFLQKLTDWEKECEYRWIYFDRNSGPLFVNFGSALEAIVIGERVSKTLSEDFYRFGARYEADVANLNWRNGFPTLEFFTQPYVTHRHLLDK